MRVAVRLFAYLIKYSPDGNDQFTLEMDPGATISGIVTQLSIPTSEARITLVNGRHAQDDLELHDGDSVALLTPMEGG